MKRLFSSFKQLLSRTRLHWLLRSLERKSVALTLATLALCLGFATFVVLSGGMSFVHYALIEPLVLLATIIIRLMSKKLAKAKHSCTK